MRPRVVFLRRAAAPSASAAPSPFDAVAFGTLAVKKTYECSCVETYRHTKKQARERTNKQTKEAKETQKQIIHQPNKPASKQASKQASRQRQRQRQRQTNKQTNKQTNTEQVNKLNNKRTPSQQSTTLPHLCALQSHSSCCSVYVQGALRHRADHAAPHGATEKRCLE